MSNLSWIVHAGRTLKKSKTRIDVSKQKKIRQSTKCTCHNFPVVKHALLGYKCGVTGFLVDKQGKPRKGQIQLFFP